MLLGFQTELHPNNQQKILLAKHAGVVCHANKLGFVVNNKHPYSTMAQILIVRLNFLKLAKSVSR